MEKEKTNKNEFCPCLNEKTENNDSFKQMKQKCQKGAKWFSLIPGVLVVLVFLFGYYADPATLRILWLIITGTLIVLGTTFYIFMNIWMGSFKKSLK